MKFHLLLVMLLLAFSASAEINLISPIDDVLFTTALQQFTFVSSQAASECTLNLNNKASGTVNNVAINETIAIINELPDNNYNWSVSCLTPAQVYSEVRDFTIDTNAPKVELKAPIHGAKLNSNKINLTFTPTDLRLKSCKVQVMINSGWTTLATLPSVVSGSAKTYTTELVDGTYPWNVECEDQSARKAKALFDQQFTIDTKPPKILSYIPFSVITEKSATISVTTDEASFCRYSTTSNQTFSQMNEFERTEFTLHRQFVEGVEEGINIFYVKCQDMLQNEMNEEKILVDVHLLPTAQIKLNKKGSIMSGQVDIVLIPSKELSQPPYLAYSLDNSAPIEIALSYDEQEEVWTGHIIINDDPITQIGKFIFSGKDRQGYTGSIITSGKTFIVDTKAPTTVAEIKAELVNGYPKVSWHTDERDISNFEIYRSTQAGVTILDYYKNTTLMTYSDRDVQAMQTYYYRIAALDKAGNRGKLSAEVFETVPQSSGTTQNQPKPVVEEKPKPLPPNLVILVNEKIKEIDSNLLAVRQAKSSLDTLTGERKKFADELSIIQNADNSKVKLESIIRQLGELKSTYHTESELKLKLSKFDLDAAKAMSSLISDLQIEEQTTYVQELTKEDVARAVNQIIQLLQLNDDTKDDFIKNNYKLMQDFKISFKIDVLALKSYNGEVSKTTVFQKSISYQGETPLQDVIVLEFIPKTVVESASEIDFIGAIPEIVKDDPVLKWGFVELGFDASPLKYAVKGVPSFSDAKDTRTVPIVSINNFAQGSKVTGFITYNTFTGSFAMTSALVVLTILGLGYYYIKPNPLANPFTKTVKEPLSVDLLADINRKLASMRLDIDDTLYPLVLNINNSIAQQKQVSGIEVVLKLIESSQHYITNGQMNKAKDTYHAISIIYPNLSKEQKSKISAKCLEIRKALT